MLMTKLSAYGIYSLDSKIDEKCRLQEIYMTFDVEVEALSEDKKTDYSVEKIAPSELREGFIISCR